MFFAPSCAGRNGHWLGRQIVRGTLQGEKFESQLRPYVRGTQHAALGLARRRPAGGGAHARGRARQRAGIRGAAMRRVGRVSAG